MTSQTVELNDDGIARVQLTVMKHISDEHGCRPLLHVLITRDVDSTCFVTLTLAQVKELRVALDAITQDMKAAAREMKELGV